MTYQGNNRTPFRSEGEPQVARLLERSGIAYRYEPPVAVVDAGKVRIWYPDFQLPQYGLLIEYCGRCGDPAYASGIRKKEAVYRANGLATLFLTPESFRGDWPSRTLEQIEAILVERLTSFRTVRGRAAPIRRGNSRPNAVHVP